jgi:hypothetical protein
MSDEVRDDSLSAETSAATAAETAADAASLVDGPLRPFALGRRAVLQSLATGVGAAVIAAPATASAHVHQAAPAAKPAAAAPRAGAAPALVFLDRHAFDTLVLLADQIVPGARAAKVPEFLDGLLAVESSETQKRVMQAIGAFERVAREAHTVPWKKLTATQATALLTKMSTAPAADGSRRAFELVKSAVSETYYSTQAGMKELGWNGGVMFAAPINCG